MKTWVIHFLLVGIMLGLPALAQRSNGKAIDGLSKSAGRDDLAYQRLETEIERIKTQVESEPCFEGTLREKFNSALIRARQILSNGDTTRAVEYLRRQVSDLKNNYQQLKKFDGKIRRIEKLLDETLPLLQNYRDNVSPKVENALRKLNQLYEEALKNRRECKVRKALNNFQNIESLIKKYKTSLLASDKLGEKLPVILQRNESNLVFIKQAKLNDKEKSSLTQVEGLQQKARNAYTEKDFKRAWRLAFRARDILFSLGRTTLTQAEQAELKIRVQRMRHNLELELEQFNNFKKEPHFGRKEESQLYQTDIQTFINNSRKYSEKGDYAAALRELQNAQATLKPLEQKKKRADLSDELLTRIRQRLERISKLIEKSDVSEARQLLASAHTHYEKALALQKTGQLKKSGAEARSVVRLMGKALHLIQENSPGFNEEIQAQLHELKTRLDRAHSSCKEHQNPRCSHAVKKAFDHYVKARAHFKSHKPKRAIKHYEQALHILDNLKQKYLDIKSE